MEMKKFRMERPNFPGATKMLFNGDPCICDNVNMQMLGRPWNDVI